MLHAVHTDALPTDDEPFPHVTQLAAPALEYVPAPHAMQPVPDCEYWPAAHFTEHVNPFASLVLPAPHGRHAAAPLDGAY